MFTAYIPPSEEYCCTIALPGGRIGFGSISIPDATSVFVVDSSPKIIRYRRQAPLPEAAPETEVSLPSPDEF